MSYYLLEEKIRPCKEEEIFNQNKQYVVVLNTSEWENKKEQFDKKKTFKYELKQNKNGTNYLCDNHIINSKIYELLVESKYKLNDLIKAFFSVPI